MIDFTKPISLETLTTNRTGKLTTEHQNILQKTIMSNKNLGKLVGIYILIFFFGSPFIVYLADPSTDNDIKLILSNPIFLFFAFAIPLIAYFIGITAKQPIISDSCMIAKGLVKKYKEEGEDGSSYLIKVNDIKIYVVKDLYNFLEENSICAFYYYPLNSWNMLLSWEKIE